MKTKQFILLTSAIAMFLFLTPQESVAQWSTNFGWRNNSPEGSSGDGFLIAAGAAVVGVVVYVIIRNKGKKDRANSYLIEGMPQDLSAWSFYDEIENASELSPAERLAAHNDAPNQNNTSIDKGLMVSWRHKY